MVWFQCEDCGDNLKKPKLPNHFRQCSASKLSCIDCGKVFGQQDVEGHTQCISEAEKYGPKGQGKTTNGVNTKPQNDAKKKPEVDINVGLSERPPWFCSLCNTKATSKQTLLLQADGKRHRAKARGFHAKQQSSNTVEINDSAEKNATNKVPENNDLDDSRDYNPSKVATPCDGSGVENKSLESNKKRNFEASENAIQIEGAETEVTKGMKKAKLSEKEEHAKLNSTADKDVYQKEIKWKKLITSALKSNPDGALKPKELKKSVMNYLKDSGYIVEKNQVSEMIEQKIDSSSRFVVDGKYTRLATSS